jgi:alkylation response protein AidB-like acyl-CoA dehydrogenase
MDLELDADQLELEEHARAVLQDRCPPAVVREVFEGRGTGATLWTRLVELGWPSVAAPQDVGGLGMGTVAEAVLTAELGRAVAPVPFLATVTQFSPLLAEAGARELWRRVNDGTRTGALALAETGGSRLADVRATATFHAGVWQLDGVKCTVPDALTADELAVVARLDGTTGTAGVGAFLHDRSEEGCTIEPLDSIDPTTPLATVRLDAAVVDADRVLLDPRDPASGAAVERVRLHATAMLAVSCVATCRALFETTLGYARSRHQFGRPIGQFQAVKHRLADLYLAVERAEALCWHAVLCVAEHAPEEPVAVAMAKAAAGDCRRLATHDALQLHGAIGFTWEHDLHLWIKRATAVALLYGDVETHRADLASLLGLLAAPEPQGASL